MCTLWQPARSGPEDAVSRVYPQREHRPIGFREVRLYPRAVDCNDFRLAHTAHEEPPCLGVVGDVFRNQIALPQREWLTGFLLSSICLTMAENSLDPRSDDKSASAAKS